MDSMIQAQASQAVRQAAASAPPALSGAGGGAAQFTDPAQAREAAESFEAFFLGQMLQPMFASLSTEPPFGGGHAESTWRSMLVQEYGSEIARSGGVGIADAVMRTLLTTQEA